MKKYYITILIIIPFIVFSQQENISTFEKTELIKEHNKYRNEVNINSVKWCDTLANEAQEWANHLSKTGCGINHSRKKGIGENIFWASASVTPKEVISSWASEKKFYKHRKCCKGYKTLHYTQIVWEKTTLVGCGKAICKDGSQVWVCNYSPQGNIIGEKPYIK